MNIKKIKIYYVIFFSFTYATVYWLFNAFYEGFRTNWIRYPIAFITMILVQSVSINFMIIYKPIKVKEILYEDNKVSFYTSKNVYSFDVEQCSKIIETKKYLVFEFNKLKFGLRVYSENRKDLDIDLNKFPSAKFINKIRKAI